MKKVLAVSGGVDSMVMLEFFVRNYGNKDIIIAHFDHGIRKNSYEDAEFVKSICAKRDLTFVSERVELDDNASESLAREKRYSFLQKVANMHNGEIFTAHHLDDLVESIAINCLRGTGWRGVDVLDGTFDGIKIRRPFLERDFFEKTFSHAPAKKNLLRLAGEWNIKFREDQTNNSEKYLRNRVRGKLTDLSINDKLKIFKIWESQKELRCDIEKNINEILPEKTWERAWFDKIDDKIALELLRAGVIKIGATATRLQLNDFLHAIRNYPPASYFNLPGDKLIKLNKKDFELV